MSLPEIFAVDLLTNPTSSATFTIPADPFFVGQSFYSQAVSFDAGANAFGLISSNGVTSVMSSF